MTENSARQQLEIPEYVSEHGPLFELRSLLVGPEQVELDGLKKRLDDPSRRAAEVSEVLPEALTIGAPDRKLQVALMPSVEEAIEVSVKRRPHVLVNAIFPLIGPAIRRSISSTLASMIQSLNESLERAFSLSGLKWRLEAIRTNKPFAEVVFLHTLVYRVEQVLLIDEKTGLLLQHVVDPNAASHDAQVISGMLSAIRDFVRDSFRVDQTEFLETMKVGELTVLVEPGQRAFLAGVIRGTVPPDLRRTFQEAIEIIHRDCGRSIENFTGDTAPFEVIRPALESCFQKRYASTAKPKRRALWAVCLITVVLFVALLHVVSNNWRWSGYVGRLKNEKGLVLIDAHAGLERYYITGLRDPLAVAPDTMLQQSKLRSEQIVSNWHSYFSAVPEFVLARARTMLRPPEGVRLDFTDGTLRSTGHAPHAWLNEARRLAVVVPGVATYDDSQLKSDWQELVDQATEIERTDIRFDLGSAVIRSQNYTNVVTIASNLRALADDATNRDAGIRVEIVGHTDRSGTEQSNDELAAQRARAVVRVLRRQSINPALLAARSVGSREPISTDQAADDSLNRRVTFRIRFESATAPR